MCWMCLSSYIFWFVNDARLSILMNDLNDFSGLIINVCLGFDISYLSCESYDIKNIWKIGACLDSFFWSLITHHSSLKIPCLFGTITHFPSLNIFHTICGPHTCHRCSFFIFFFSTQTHWIQCEKKKKRSKDGQKLRLWVPYVYLITIIS